MVAGADVRCSMHRLVVAVEGHLDRRLQELAVRVVLDRGAVQAEGRRRKAVVGRGGVVEVAHVRNDLLVVSRLGARGVVGRRGHVDLLLGLQVQVGVGVGVAGSGHGAERAGLVQPTTSTSTASGETGGRGGRVAGGWRLHLRGSDLAHGRKVLIVLPDGAPCPRSAPDAARRDGWQVLGQRGRGAPCRDRLPVVGRKAAVAAAAPTTQRCTRALIAAPRCGDRQTFAAEASDAAGREGGGGGGD